MYQSYENIDRYIFHPLKLTCTTVLRGIAWFCAPPPYINALVRPWCCFKNYFFCKEICLHCRLHWCTITNKYGRNQLKDLLIYQYIVLNANIYNIFVCIHLVYRTNYQKKVYTYWYFEISSTEKYNKNLLNMIII